MLGYFLPRAFLMVFGYAYPAYQCFKTVEKEPEIEHLLSWCHYWIIVAVLTVFERLIDAFVSWLPMYGEAKLALFIYLWCSKMKGTEYVYNCIFKPFMVEHEEEIDRRIGEVKVTAGDFVSQNWKMGLAYGRARSFEILRRVSSLAPPPPPPSSSENDKEN
ncbi:hypothetical protein FNV43_RR21697 [Rhamnella rubrinervis]|uniref:HVA22-like protein n=1 Tax=Rhamnella rubrinervis TaxID=2594499 RepID=A0A8K0DNV0_9ROSA|nr:hypothetical protein FNV43_RR21697 [Rhamnella rubrinervis]